MIFTIFFYACKSDIVTTEPANPFAVDIEKIKSVSANFQNELTENDTLKNAKIVGNETKLIDHIENKKNEKGNTMMYIIHYKKNAKGEAGYLMLSGDKRVEPILGFSETDTYDNTNPGLQIMTQRLLEDVEFIASSKKEQEPREKSAWDNYEKNNKNARVKSTTYDCQPWYPNYPNCCPPDYEIIQGPNFTTNWHQGVPYNESSPSRACNSNGKANAGCGPIAIAQLVNYYTLPSSRSKFGITGPNKPVISNPFPFPFPNYYNNSRLGEFIGLMGSFAQTNYFYPGCSSLTWRENVASALSACGYASGGNRINYTNNPIAIYNEVKSGRPIIMDGTTGFLNFSNWHIWAVDGYREKQWSTITNGTCNTYMSSKFHHNWGQGDTGTWCTQFDIHDSDNPSISNNYTSNLNATINIRP